MNPLAAGADHLLVEAESVTQFTWDYEPSNTQLTRLYEKGKVSQWNATTDVDWSPDVRWGEPDPSMTDEERAMIGSFLNLDAPDSPFVGMSEEQRALVGWELQAWMVSQFMHGEQGALVATARLVETVPDIESKYYAANQVNDEARHVEAYATYLNSKLPGHEYEISGPLEALLVDIMTEKRWDITYLGMQIMVEGLALAAFGFMHAMTTEPLLKQLLRYVMSDEARHVAFGVLSLKEYYENLSDAEMFERQQFAFEAAVRMRDRFLQQEVFDRMGIPVKDAIQAVMHTPTRQLFQMMLFSKIVPNCKKLGLLDRNDQWLRRRFEELNVIQFEDLTDTADEMESFALSKDELASSSAAL